VIQCFPDEGRVGAGELDARYEALGFTYLATFRVEAEGTSPFRRELWIEPKGTSLTIGPSGLSGTETAFHTVGADGTIVRTFTVDATDAERMPGRLGLRRAGLHDELLVDAAPDALLLRHVERAGRLLRGPRWPIRTLDDELKLNARTSALLSASGDNSAQWVLRLLGGVLAGIVGMLLGLCGLPPANGWLITGGGVTLLSILGMWALFSRRWTPGPFPALSPPETW
jgi:hypothetical protein